MKRSHIMVFLLVAIALFSLKATGIAQNLQVRVDRFLEVRQLVGTVTVQRGGRTQPAQNWMQLQNVGDSITTSSNASASLLVDTGVGTISISERTTLRINQMQTLPSGGKITRLSVTGGQARLQLRRFTNRDSRLDVETPAGVSGVRGTTFGVSVQPDGKTGVATLEGSVATSAQGQSVMVDAGLQSLVIPGEPPTPPTPLQEDTRLDLRELSIGRNRTLRAVGQVDRVNLLLIGDEPQVLDRDGQFDLNVPLPNNRVLEVTVVTPLGKRQTYQLAVP